MDMTMEDVKVVLPRKVEGKKLADLLLSVVKDMPNVYKSRSYTDKISREISFSPDSLSIPPPFITYNVEFSLHVPRNPSKDFSLWEKLFGPGKGRTINVFASPFDHGSNHDSFKYHFLQSETWQERYYGKAFLGILKDVTSNLYDRLEDI